ALAGEILKLCVGLGGSITGEHGVGMEKRAYMPAMFSEGDLALMQRLRRALDPDELANRGKMFPQSTVAAGALRHSGPHPLEQAGVISRE
ncbi:MAG: FAD-binding oxidoreductase, partial [Armatimonadota bacterium]